MSRAAGLQKLSAEYIGVYRFRSGNAEYKDYLIRLETDEQTKEQFYSVYYGIMNSHYLFLFAHTTAVTCKQMLDLKLCTLRDYQPDKHWPSCCQTGCELWLPGSLPTAAASSAGCWRLGFFPNSRWRRCLEQQTPSAAVTTAPDEEPEAEYDNEETESNGDSELAELWKTLAELEPNQLTSASATCAVTASRVKQLQPPGMRGPKPPKPQKLLAGRGVGATAATASAAPSGSADLQQQQQPPPPPTRRTPVSAAVSTAGPSSLLDSTLPSPATAPLQPPLTPGKVDTTTPTGGYLKLQPSARGDLRSQSPSPGSKPGAFPNPPPPVLPKKDVLPTPPILSAREVSSSPQGLPNKDVFSAHPVFPTKDTFPPPPVLPTKDTFPPPPVLPTKDTFPPPPVLPTKRGLVAAPNQQGSSLLTPVLPPKSSAPAAAGACVPPPLPTRDLSPQPPPLPPSNHRPSIDSQASKGGLFEMLSSAASVDALCSYYSKGYYSQESMTQAKHIMKRVTGDGAYMLRGFCNRQAGQDKTLCIKYGTVYRFRIQMTSAGYQIGNDENPTVHDSMEALLFHHHLHPIRVRQQMQHDLLLRRPYDLEVDESSSSVSSSSNAHLTKPFYAALWNHGSKEQCAEVLKNSADGTYTLRGDTASGAIVLCVMHRGQILKFRIVVTKTCEFSFHHQAGSVKFYTLEDFLVYHHREPIRGTAAEGDIILRVPFQLSPRCQQELDFLQLSMEGVFTGDSLDSARSKLQRKKRLNFLVRRSSGGSVGGDLEHLMLVRDENGIVCEFHIVESETDLGFRPQKIFILQEKPELATDRIEKMINYLCSVKQFLSPDINCLIKP